MARKDERGVVFPAPLHFNNPATAGLPRVDDGHRGPAVTDSYGLSHCRIDLAERSEGWPTPATLPPCMVEFAQSVPEDQRADWLRRQANIEEADRHIAKAMRSGELPIWVAPIGEPERLVASDAIVEVDHATVVSGVYRPPNDRGWLYGRPLFVKKDDWVRFVANIEAERIAEKKTVIQSSLDKCPVGERQHISVRDAIRVLHQRVKAAVPDADPAPWLDVSPDLIDMFSEGDEVTFVRRKKLEERSKLVLQRGLLSGALRAHFSDGLESRAVPGWSWAGAERNEHVWFEGRLPLDVFLPDDWQRWSCHLVYLDRDTFKEWIDSQPLHDPADLPALPIPYDAQSKPEPVKNRLPPDAPFVTLSEALSWIAVGVALDRDSLDRAISGHAFKTADPQAALSAAMSKLADRASGSQVAMRGKFVESHATDENEVLTALIDPVRFADFAQFDILYDGLRYGTGLTWNGLGSALDRVFQDRRGAYRSVTVDRDSLMQWFPPPEAVSGFPLAVTVGELTLPGDDFDLNAEVPVSPWWSLLQTVGWITTGSKAYVGYVAELEGAAHGDIGTSVAFSAIVTYVARKHCRCAAHGRPDDKRWEYCTCTGDAGRGLLEVIRTDRAKAIKRATQGLKQLSFYDLAGVGQRPTCVDWLSHDFSLQFSSAEVIAAFPAHQGEQSKSAPKARKRPGPAPDPDWPHAIAKVTQDCIAAGYKRTQKRGDKAAIQTMLLNYMSAKDKHFSPDIAAKHAKTVIAALPDN